MFTFKSAFGLAVIVLVAIETTELPGSTLCFENGPGHSSTPPTTGSVEVRFANGSIVVMNMLQEKVEIATEYGNLTVPLSAIQQIEFGLRPTDDERRRVSGAIQRLSSTVYREREEAVVDLVAQGPLAYPQLKGLAPSDAETTKRSEEILRRIREKYHPSLLRVREDDQVRTAKFTIVGRITNATIKARADEFGELELKPARLLSMRWLADSTNKEITVDAAKYASPNDRKWLDTGVMVSASMGLKITATGQVDTWPQQPGQYMSGPDGAGGGPGGGGRNGNSGALMGRIGTEGTPFLVGARHTQNPKESGKLYLQIVPSQWGGASAGEFRVTIATGNFDSDE